MCMYLFRSISIVQSAGRRNAGRKRFTVSVAVVVVVVFWGGNEDRVFSRSKNGLSVNFLLFSHSFVCLLFRLSSSFLPSFSLSPSFFPFLLNNRATVFYVEALLTSNLHEYLLKKCFFNRKNSFKPDLRCVSPCLSSVATKQQQQQIKVKTRKYDNKYLSDALAHKQMIASRHNEANNTNRQLNFLTTIGRSNSAKRRILWKQLPNWRASFFRYNIYIVLPPPPSVFLMAQKTIQKRKEIHDYQRGPPPPHHPSFHQFCVNNKIVS